MLSRKQQLRARRAARTRARIHGTAARPRLSVFRSSRHFSAQLIDDVAQRTMASVSDVKAATGRPLERAAALGGLIARKAQALSVEQVVFDRGAYAYHGCVRAFAEAAREAGLKF